MSSATDPSSESETTQSSTETEEPESSPNHGEEEEEEENADSLSDAANFKEDPHETEPPQNPQPDHSSPQPPPPLPEVKKSDRYGWSRSERTMTKRETKLIRIYESKEDERTLKWQKMLKDFGKFRVYHRNKYEERVRKGIPDTWRCRAWVWILDKLAEKEESTGNRTRKDIMFYFNKGVPDEDDVIKKDIPRTMPNNQMFFKEDTQERFYRILRAYTNASTQYGYVQGMAFPAAMLIAYVPDDYQVFWAFMHLMNGERIGLARLYQGNFDGLRNLNLVWDLILKKKHRAIWKNLNQLSIEHMMYTTTYFLCAFMNCSYPTFLRLRIFDRFVCSGFRALVSLALSFVEMHKDALRNGEFEVVLPLLRDPPCEDFSVLLELWDKEWLSEEEFDKWCRKAKVSFKKNPKRKMTL